jgi:hypothetical protein
MIFVSPSKRNFEPRLPVHSIIGGHLRYKPEGRGFESRWCNWNFSLTSFGPYHVLGFNSASNRNEYQEYFLSGKGGRCVVLITLPPSCADCLEIWESYPPETLKAFPGLNKDCFAVVIGQYKFCFTDIFVK